MTRLLPIKLNVWRWWFIAMAFTFAYYVLQLVALVFRFGQFPNYINVYDWFHNIGIIINSTPSLKDTLLIIRDEWLIETGYMSFDYGRGISVWSLYLAPAKVALVFIFSALLSANILLFRAAGRNCSRRFATNFKLANGLGASLVTISSLTMSWVVCCSTPTWVVGLSMLGVGVTTALQLEPLGAWLCGVGFVLLLMALLVQARRLAGKKSATPLPSNSREFYPCRPQAH